MPSPARLSITILEGSARSLTCLPPGFSPLSHSSQPYAMSAASPATPARIAHSVPSHPSTPAPTAAHTPSSTTAAKRKMHAEQLTHVLQGRGHGLYKKQRSVPSYNHSDYNTPFNYSMHSVDDLDRYRRAARWLAWAYDPFLNLSLAFHAGARAEIETLIASAREAGDVDEVADLEALDEDPAVAAMYVHRVRDVHLHCSCISSMPGTQTIVPVM